MSNHRDISFKCEHCNSWIDTLPVPKANNPDWSNIINALAEHVESHKQEYEMQCEVCDYSETHDNEGDAAEQLKQHILNDHPGWITNLLTDERRQGVDLW